MTTASSSGTFEGTDIVLIDFLQTDVMRRNFPKLCPASSWALAHCMDKQRFTFGIVTGTNQLRGDANFLLEFNRYLEGSGYELVAIASCTGHSFVITREIAEGESDDIDYLTVGSLCQVWLDLPRHPLVQ